MVDARLLRGGPDQCAVVAALQATAVGLPVREKEGAVGLDERRLSRRGELLQDGPDVVDAGVGRYVLHRYAAQVEAGRQLQPEDEAEGVLDPDGAGAAP